MSRFSPTRLGASKRGDEAGPRRRGLVLLIILLGSMMPCLFLQQSYIRTHSNKPTEVSPEHWLSSEQLQNFQTSLESVASTSKEVVIVLAGNKDHLIEENDLLENFIYFARDVELAENVLLVALDPHTAAAGSEIGYGHVFSFFNTTVPRTEIKYQILTEAVALGHTVLFSTLDFAWLTKPWKVLAAGQNVQLIEQRPPPVLVPEGELVLGRKGQGESESQTIATRRLQSSGRSKAGAGVAYLRPSASTLTLLRTVLEAVSSYPGVAEEEVLNAVLQLADAERGGSWQSVFRQGEAFSWECLHRGEHFWDGLAEVQSDPPTKGDHFAGAFDSVGGSFSLRNLRYRFREGGLWGPDRTFVACIQNPAGGNQEEGGGLQREGKTGLGQRRLHGENGGQERCRGGQKFMYYFEELEHNGLNNQRQELRTALAMAEHMGRTLILPNFYRQHKQPARVLLDYFFDYDAFEVEFPDALPGYMLEALFPDWEKLPIQHIDISTDPAPPPNATWLGRVTSFKASRFHFGATEQEVTSWFGDSAEPLLVFYSAFRRFGQYKDAAKQLAFDRRVFRGLGPHPVTAALRNQTVAAVRQVSSNQTYNCFHLRRGDTFLTLHPKFEKSMEEIVELLKTYLPPNEVLFISTDASIEETRGIFTGGGYSAVHFLGDYFPSWGWNHVTAEDGEETMRLGQIDQAVCAQGKRFVGNYWSTFTLHIGFIRRMKGEEQVCQDIYAREEMVGPDFVFY